MKPDFTNFGAVKRAVIYCRVSSRKQKTDGSGLNSQEQRCRKYALEHGYLVEAVFPDDVSGGGDFMKRPGMVALLNYLDDQIGEEFVVIFDDLKRFARDTEFHLALRRALRQRNATVECPNFKFEDTPEGKFVETILAATGTLEREQNGRQVLQKMHARVESGFWVFRAPVGYKYVKSQRGGKELVADEPAASVVKEALEGYATGRLSSQTEVRRFLEANPHFPSDMPNGDIRPQTIVRLLGKAVYAGYVSAPAWGISLRDGHHEGLISKATYERIQERLNEGVYAARRKDIHADFPLRGAVCCASCSTPLTAGWCKGKRQKYPYYFYRKKGCDLHGKMIRRSKIESAFLDMLKAMSPTEKLFELAITMFRDAWDQKAAQVTNTVATYRTQALEVEKTIAGVIDTASNVSNPRLIETFEKRLEELEREKLVLLEKAKKSAVPRYTFEQLFEHCIRFLASPCKLWESGKFDLQRLVLRLTVSEHLVYCRERGFLNTNFALPIKALGMVSGGHVGDGAAGEI